MPSSLVTRMRTASTVAPLGDGPACSTWTSVEIGRVTPSYGDILPHGETLFECGHRRAGSVLVVLSVAAGVAGFLGPAGAGAAAAVQGGEAIQTTLRYDEDGEQVFVEGAEVTVTDSTGAELGSATSDAEGRVRIEVPGPGTYTATLDEATLPEEVAIAPGGSAEVSTTIEAGRTGNVIFPLQFGEITSTSSADDITLRRIAQLGVEGIKIGLFLALAAIGLSLIYGTTGLVNFAHGEMITFGMLAAYFFNFYGFAGIAGFLKDAPPVLGDGVNLVWATVLATIAGGVLGYLLDALLFAPMRRKGISNVAALVVTIGLALVSATCCYLVRRPSRGYRDYTVQEELDIGADRDHPAGPHRDRPSPSSRWSPSCLGPPADPHRQGDAGGVGQPRPGRVVRHRRRAGDPVRLGVGGGLAALGGVLLRRSAAGPLRDGLPAAAADVRRGHPRRPRYRLRRPGGLLVVGLVIECRTLWIPTELKTSARWSC